MGSELGRIVQDALTSNGSASGADKIITSRKSHVIRMRHYHINVVIKVVMSPDPARFPWHEVKKVEHYYLSVDALTQPMRVQERPEPYGKLTT